MNTTQHVNIECAQCGKVSNMFRVESNTCPHCGSRDVSETTKLVAPNTTQDWREEFDDKWGGVLRVNEPHLSSGVRGASMEIKAFIEKLEHSLIEGGRLQGIEEAKGCVPAERSDPGDFGGTDDKLVREQWWGFEICRKQTLTALDKLKGE